MHLLLITSLLLYFASGSVLKLPSSVLSEVGSFLGPEYMKLGLLNKDTRERYLERPLQHQLALKFGLKGFEKLPSSIELFHLDSLIFENTAHAIKQIVGSDSFLPETTPVICASIAEYCTDKTTEFENWHRVILRYMIKHSCTAPFLKLSSAWLIVPN